MTRYAIYFAPPAGSPFEDCGARALGRNPSTGAPVQIAPVEGLDEDALLAATDSPRRYGFHGTLKAPFRLVEGAKPSDLLTAAETLANSIPAFEIPALKIGLIGGFVALVSDRPVAALQNLATTCVTELDTFRAPMTAAERERRNPAKLSERQRAYLDQFGYPYVVEEFRFHLTLSERSDDATGAKIAASREILFADLLGKPVPIDAISIFQQVSPDAPFHIVQQVPLAAQKS